MKHNIWGMDLQEIEKWVVENKFPKYRAKQLRDYLYKRFIFSFDQMTQLPLDMRTWLNENAYINKPEIIGNIQSDDGNTTKLLLKLQDGSLVETVCMHHSYGNSICVFNSGRMCNGLYILCFRTKRIGTEFNCRRNFISNLCF